MIFYLGTHQPHWLGLLDVPLMVSRRTLSRMKTPPRAKAPWTLDSGGFSELTMYGRWTVTPQDYVREVDGWANAVGRLEWAAIQDWMTEPVVTAKTGLTIFDHQKHTIRSYLDLVRLAPWLPWTPVLQGQTMRDYLRHHVMYARVGFRLSEQPAVGLGSVCRRQATGEIGEIVCTLAALGLRLHGFGVKSEGLKKYGAHLASADSLAWSFAARRMQRPAYPACTHTNCANCPVFALDWRKRLLGR